MAEINDVFWFEGDSEQAGLVHRITEVRSGYTPVDSECEEYLASCGISGQSWCSCHMGVPETHIARIPPAGIAKCPVCFFGAEKKEESERPKCPKCGQCGVCYHDGDISAGPTYIDQYRFECSNPSCRFTDSQTVSGGDTACNNWFTKCPYCGLGGD